MVTEKAQKDIYLKKHNKQKKYRKNPQRLRDGYGNISIEVIALLFLFEKRGGKYTVHTAERLLHVETHDCRTIIPNKMKCENMPEMTYRYITMMIWSVARHGESNRLV